MHSVVAFGGISDNLYVLLMVKIFEQQARWLYDES